MKAPLMLIGIVVLAAGLVFVGQGLGYIRWPASSFMISEIKWAYYGGGIPDKRLRSRLYLGVKRHWSVGEISKKSRT